MKRYRNLIIFGLSVLLLAVAAAMSPEFPVAGTHGSGFGPADDVQRAALADTHQGVVIRPADPVTANSSRIHPSSPSGIASRPLAAVCLNEHGLGSASILPVSSREIGFHALLRAPPDLLKIA